MDYIILGENIRKYRRAVGMTQEKLGEECERSDSHIGQIENARGIPSLETTVNIANVLNVTVDQLLAENYTHPEQVYLKEIAERISKYSVADRIRACEAFSNYLDMIERWGK